MLGIAHQPQALMVAIVILKFDKCIGKLLKIL